MIKDLVLHLLRYVRRIRLLAPALALTFLNL